MKQAVCAVYMTDVTKSITEIKQGLAKYRKEIEDRCRADIIDILVVNKSDIVLRKLDKTTGVNLARKTGFFKYIEMSALNGTNTGKLIESILNEVDRKALWQQERRNTISLMTTDVGSKS